MPQDDEATNQDDRPENLEPPPPTPEELGLLRLKEAGIEPVSYPNRPSLALNASYTQTQDLQHTPVISHTSRVQVQSLDSNRILQAKAAFALRRVPKNDMCTLISGAVRPRSGDVVLAVVDRLRQHPRIELASGRRSNLREGQEIILACGNRYATDQFEAVVPDKLGKAHMVAAGGVAGIALHKALGMKPATEITLLGLIGNESGVPLNLMSYALDYPKEDVQRPPVLTVFGTAMNSGKTTTAQTLVRGLTEAGYRVGYAKITGTGAGGDYWAVLDAGAFAVVDFTDAGLPSTYLLPIPVIEEVAITLIGHLASVGCEQIVVEVADGLLQRETKVLLRSEVIHALVDRVLFAAGDAIAATAGVKILQDAGFHVVGVSGLVSASPLPAREATENATVPVWTRDDLLNPMIASTLMGRSSTNINEESLSRKTDAKASQAGASPGNADTRNAEA